MSTENREAFDAIVSSCEELIKEKGKLSSTKGDENVYVVNKVDVSSWLAKQGITKEIQEKMTAIREARVTAAINVAGEHLTNKVIPAAKKAGDNLDVQVAGVRFREEFGTQEISMKGCGYHPTSFGSKEKSPRYGEITVAVREKRIIPSESQSEWSSKVEKAIVG